MTRRALPILLALCASVASAGDRLSVTGVRFSASGDWVLAVTSGERDGSGAGSAQLDVLSTRDARAAYHAEATSEAAPGAVLAALLGRPAVQAALKRFGVSPGGARPRTLPFKAARTPSPGLPRWEDGVPPGRIQLQSAALWTRPVPVRLSVFAARSDCPRDWLPPGERAAGFSLRVGTQVIWTDQALPAARRCAARYALDRVDVQGNRVLVTLRAFQPGFEGPDATPVFVAATLR